MGTNFYLDNEDLRFQLERAFDWSEITALLERDFTAQDGFATAAEALEFYRDICENVGKYVAEQVAPRAAEMDAAPPRLEGGEVVTSTAIQEVFEGFKDMGLYALNLPRELGGLNCPMTLYYAIGELVSRADPAVLGHYAFHGGIAMTLLVYALHEGAVERADGAIVATRFEEAIREIAAGDAFGCMVLTEPDAGSDLANLRAKACLDDAGVWRLTGQKIFITSGHAQYHLVLAKTETTGQGLADLSLFLVRRKVERDGVLVDNVIVERLEEKLGLHASVTCALSYEDSAAELIGKRGEGFVLMLQLMNGARLGVSFEGLGLIEAVHRMAKQYAEERTSMGKPIAQQEMVADYLDQMDTESKGMRALCFEAAQVVDLYQLLERKLVLDPPREAIERQALEKRVRALKWRARELTPLLKYETAERAVALASLALQIHGGVGYTKDYLVEKFLRDAFVLPIYEGTSQIQALMALKDQLQAVLKNPTRFVRKLAQARVRAVSRRDPLVRQLAQLELKLYSAIQHILTRIARDKWNWVSERKISEWPKAFLKEWDSRRDFSYGLLHAERLTRILVAVETGRVLCRQASRFPERRELAERYLERKSTLVTCMHDEILHTGDRLLRTLATERAAAALGTAPRN